MVFLRGRQLMSDCVFCQRVDKQDYITRILYLDEVVAFEPLNPVTPGHMLFVSRRHYQSVAHADLRVTGCVFESIADYASRRGEDFNLITSRGAAATQTIQHLHVHYVPRRAGDGLMLPWSNQQGDEQS